MQTRFQKNRGDQQTICRPSWFLDHRTGDGGSSVGIDSARGVKSLHEFELDRIDSPRPGRRPTQQRRGGTSRQIFIGSGGSHREDQEDRPVQGIGSFDRIVESSMDVSDRGRRILDRHPAESHVQYFRRGLDRGGTGEPSVSSGPVRKEKIRERIVDQGVNSRQNGIGIRDQRRIEWRP